MNIFFVFDIIVNLRTRGVYFDRKLRRTVQVASFSRSGGRSFRNRIVRSCQLEQILLEFLIIVVGALLGVYSVIDTCNRPKVHFVLDSQFVIKRDLSNHLPFQWILRIALNVSVILASFEITKQRVEDAFDVDGFAGRSPRRLASRSDTCGAGHGRPFAAQS